MALLPAEDSDMLAFKSPIIVTTRLLTYSAAL